MASKSKSTSTKKSIASEINLAEFEDCLKVAKKDISKFVNSLPVVDLTGKSNDDISDIFETYKSLFVMMGDFLLNTKE
jgi:hypothetical protein